MTNESDSNLGFKLISVTVVLTAVAALMVGIVVSKLSEDAGKQRLYHGVEMMAVALLDAADKAADDAEAALEEAQAEEGAELAPESEGHVELDATDAMDAINAMGAIDEDDRTLDIDLEQVLLETAISEGGSVFVMDTEGSVLAHLNPDLFQGEEVGDLEMELTSVSQPLSDIGEKDDSNLVALVDLVGAYESGSGLLEIGEYETAQTLVIAFRNVTEQEWMVAVAEPEEATGSATASIKRYILLTIVVLVIAVIASTAISVPLIIKPYYSEQMALSAKISAANRNLKKLHEVSLGMQKHLELDKRMIDILNAARDVVGLDRIFIFMPDDKDGAMLQCRGAVGNEEEAPEYIRIPIGAGGGAISRSFATKEICRVTSGDISGEFRLKPPYSEIKALRSREFVAMPLIVENKCVGVVAADNQLSKIPITKEKIEGITLFINQAAVAIQNANMYAKLRGYADMLEVTDHLTKTFIFDHFKKYAEVAAARVNRGETRLAMGAITMVNLTEYNRKVGHNSGNALLVKVADKIKSLSDEDSIVGRCLGSTFGVLYLGDAVETAGRTMDELAKALAAVNYPNEELLDDKEIHFVCDIVEYDAAKGESVNDYVNSVIKSVREKITT